MRGKPVTDELKPRRGRQLAVDVAAAALLFLAVAEFFAGAAILVSSGDNRSGGFTAIAFGVCVAPPLAYFLIKRSRGYAQRDPRGIDEGLRRHRRTIRVAGAAMIAGAVVFTGWSVLYYGSPADPTLSRTELESKVAEMVGPNSGAVMYATSIRCLGPAEYTDGDVATCTVERRDGQRTLIEAAIHRSGEVWQIDVDLA